jgi:UDP-2-acetamido-3-amino-2,3-dideoxy-glucuronate N-acetyltransferase
MIDTDVVLGKNVTVFSPELVNLFGCEIGDNSFIGPFVEITRNVKIGKNCIVESHAFICDSVILEDNVFIGHGVMFTNDLYPRVGTHVDYFKTIILEGASIGTNSTIIAGIPIGKYSIIGGGSVVTKNVEDYSIYAGNRAKKIKQFFSKEEITAYIRTRQKKAN